MKVSVLGRTFSFLANEDQWAKLWKIVEEYMFTNPCFWLAVLLCIVIVGLRINQIVRKEQRYAGWMVALYILFLVTVLILCKKREPVSFRNFALNYYVTKDGFHEGNIAIAAVYFLLFVPLGCFLRRWLTGRKALAVATAVGIGLAIESLQFAFSRGDFVVMDLAMYFTGSLLGILCRGKRR